MRTVELLGVAGRRRRGIARSAPGEGWRAAVELARPAGWRDGGGAELGDGAVEGGDFGAEERRVAGDAGGEAELQAVDLGGDVAFDAACHALEQGGLDWCGVRR